MVWHLKVTGTLEQEVECVLHVRTAPSIDSLPLLIHETALNFETTEPGSIPENSLALPPPRSSSAWDGTVFSLRSATVHLVNMLLGWLAE